MNSTVILFTVALLTIAILGYIAWNYKENYGEQKYKEGISEGALETVLVINKYGTVPIMMNDTNRTIVMFTFQDICNMIKTSTT